MSAWTSFKSVVAAGVMRVQAAFGSYSTVTGFSTDRGNIMYMAPIDTRHHLGKWTRLQILDKVDWLFQAFGIVKEKTRGVARHAVGKGHFLQMDTTDEEWNELAEADFEAFALSPDRVDKAGKRNFYEIQFHAVEGWMKAGEFFASHARNPRWDEAPCLQLWDPREVESPDIESEYIIDGVKVDGDHCPISYFVRKLGGGHAEIPASEMIHWFHADGTNQLRGVSEFAQAVNPLLDARELINITTKTAKQNSAIGMHVKKMVKAGGAGAVGTIKKMANAVQGSGGPGQEAPPSESPAYEKLVSGGAIIYTDSEGDVKFLTPNSPTPLMEPFITKVLMRDAFASSGLPMEFFWSPEGINGVTQRFILVKAENFFDWIGDGLVGRLCTPLATRYLIHRMETGKLRPCKDPLWMTKLEWQRPARITIDNGRDGKLELEQLGDGVETLRGINDRRARNWRRQTRQWFREFAYAARCSVEEGVPWAMKKWRAGMPGAQGSEEPEKDDDDETGKPGDKPKSNES